MNDITLICNVRWWSGIHHERIEILNLVDFYYDGGCYGFILKRNSLIIVALTGTGQIYNDLVCWEIVETIPEMEPNILYLYQRLIYE